MQSSAVVGLEQCCIACPITHHMVDYCLQLRILARASFDAGYTDNCFVYSVYTDRVLPEYACGVAVAVNQQDKELP